jgi:hypothetical protein
MAEFRFFTIAAGVTAIVLGAVAGTAMGEISSGPPSATGPNTPTAAMRSSTKHAAKQMGMGSGAPMSRSASGTGKTAMGGTTVGKGDAGTQGVIRLAGMPNGTVRVLLNSQGKLEAQLSVYGLTPGSSHNASIDSPHGTALSPEVRFPAFTANSVGQANVTLTATNTVAALASGSRFGIRLGTYPGGSAAQNMLAEELIASSGTLPAHPLSVMTGLHARSVGPTGKYLGRLHGWAKIGYNPAARTLSVTVTAYGLPPGAHAAHIHAGTCGDQGAVKYMLMDFMASASGSIINQTRTVGHVASAPPATGWYLNLHLGDSATILAKGMPTLNFRPELCADITGAAMGSR